MKYCAFEFKSLQVGIGLYLSSTPFPSLRSSLPSPQQTGLSPLATGNSKRLMFFLFSAKKDIFITLSFFKEEQPPTNRQRYRQPQPSLLFSQIPANTFDLKKITCKFRNLQQIENFTALSYGFFASHYKNYKNSPDHAIIELDGLLAGAGEIPSVDLEKRAPMRFVVVIMFYMKITS